MRRFLAALAVVLCALPVCAGAQVNLAGPAPSVVVFPFTPNGASIDREASGRLATIIAEQIATSKAVTVKPAPAGVERKDFLDTARRVGADYYLSGFITPLGNGVTVIEQLVSTVSGIVVYSNSASLQTYSDAAGQGDTIRNAILQHARRALAQYAAPPPSETRAPTPEPSGEKQQANLSGLFRRKKSTAAPAAASPTPAPTKSPAYRVVSIAAPESGATASPNDTPTPVAVRTFVPAPVVTAFATTVATIVPATPAPSATPALRRLGTTPSRIAGPPGIGVLTIEGEANARALLVERYDRAIRARGLPIANDAIPASAAVAGKEALCGEHHVDRWVGGSVATRAENVFGATTVSATVEIVGYDCNGNVTFRKSVVRDAGGPQALATAIERAGDAAIGAFLGYTPRRR